MNKLVFENIAIEAGNKKILKNVNLTIEKGDVLALVGPNGQGKSTLLNALMGNTEYKITEGHIYLDDIDITNLSPDEKSRLGIFMAFLRWIFLSLQLMHIVKNQFHFLNIIKC